MKQNSFSVWIERSAHLKVVDSATYSLSQPRVVNALEGIIFFHCQIRLVHCYNSSPGRFGGEKAAEHYGCQSQKEIGPRNIL